MRLLLCNDDGIHAPGIRTLSEAVADFGEVRIVAPNEERSAVGHAITVFDPLKTHDVYRGDTYFGLAVNGTPADCIKLAVCGLGEPRPDIVLSGINLGDNTGISVLYSGTVSAATEACILQLPAVAFSLCTYRDPHWDTAREIVRRITRQVLEEGLPPRTLLNVNIPNLPIDEVRGFRVVPVGYSHWIERFERRTDPRGRAYFWLDGELQLVDEEENSDILALREGYVALTPIGYDLTRHDCLDTMRAWTDVLEKA